MEIRLTHIDGKLPNLALMKLAHWHRRNGDNVHLARTPSPSMFEPSYDVVYGSTIFTQSQAVLSRLFDAYPGALVGGTGTGEWHTVEQVIGQDTYEYYDYSIYPDYKHSIGFTQRGCRLNCGFCVVPKKEGKPRATNTVKDIWRAGTERNVVLLDNDFFGQPELDWRARIDEMAEGGFKVSFSQGINIRMVNDESASALARVWYYDDQFKVRRLYTAWDNVGQERAFFKGLGKLGAAGIPARHVMVYMLIGYDPQETWERVLYRYGRLKEAGCLPYPMVYNNADPSLKRFQRWVIRRYDEIVPWEEYGRYSSSQNQSVMAL